MGGRVGVYLCRQAIRRVDMRYYDGMGYGFEASRDMNVGDFALRVPLRCLIHADAIAKLSPFAFVSDADWTIPEEPFMLFLSVQVHEVQ